MDVTSWDSLRLLRLHGKRPSLPVIVTTNPVIPRRLYDVGCMAILHKAGEAFPVKLLEGLDVILMLDTCALGSSVFRLAQVKGVKFSSLRAWCRCGSELVVAPTSCASFRETIEWMEGPHAA